LRFVLPVTMPYIGLGTRTVSGLMPVCMYCVRADARVAAGTSSIWLMPKLLMVRRVPLVPTYPALGFNAHGSSRWMGEFHFCTYGLAPWLRMMAVTVPPR